MNKVNSTTKIPFMKRIGNWFNKNGNAVGKGMQVAGATAMGVGMTGMFIDAMNKPQRSIFGCGCSPYSMMGTGFGGCCSSFGMMNPMMMNPMMMNPMAMNPMMMSMGGSIFGCC